MVNKNFGQATMKKIRDSGKAWSNDKVLVFNFIRQTFVLQELILMEEFSLIKQEKHLL